ncbi:MULTISPECIES: glycosyltransferase family 4 protein [Bacillus]|uniref:glycosyltransferase family 4 protein n=1 Tax=Bacillus TaxID=1386 RepID=UPI000EA2AA1F|nr:MULTISPECIES: glycosyltransferase family 4 protein [Bacillus]AYF09188.1 glycosyltransferase WbuB [Bacillus mobilis]BCD32267.1 glycosyltransferase WbuB [Bacillus cereus]HDX9571750.1 glycosyltransferase family 4 protein [Bacillus mobilis]
MKKKIVFVINYFYPDFASTGQLMTELCLELQDKFDITVIAAQPGYAGEAIKTKKIFEEDKLEKINIVRVRVPKVDKKSKMSRVKYILSYFTLATIALLKQRNVDIIYTISQPPVLGGIVGTIGKFFKKSKHVYNIQDFNPEQAEAVSYTNKKFVFNIARKIDKINCSYSDHVIVVGNDMAKTLEKRFDGKKVPNHSVINNWTNEGEIVPVSKDNPMVAQFIKENKLDNKFIVMYSGNIGLFYDLENIIKITKEFSHYEDLVFLFIGEGAMKENMNAFVMENGIENVLFLPYQPKEFIKYSLNVADIHLVVNQKGIKGVSVPSKIYGVMAAGKPILGVLERESEAEILITNSDCGVVVEPQDYNGIIEAIKHFYNMKDQERKEMGIRGRDYLEQNLKKETSIQKYNEVLQSL